MVPKQVLQQDQSLFGNTVPKRPAKGSDPSRNVTLGFRKLSELPGISAHDRLPPFRKKSATSADNLA